MIKIFITAITVPNFFDKSFRNDGLLGGFVPSYYSGARAISADSGRARCCLAVNFQTDILARLVHADFFACLFQFASASLFIMFRML